MTASDRCDTETSSGGWWHGRRPDDAIPAVARPCKFHQFMAKHNELGKRGEEIATDWLRQKGLEIQAVNWRFRRYELDIVARDRDTVVFVEVKTRSQTYFGPPEIFVDQRKTDRILRAASAYMASIGHSWAVRFDVVAVLFQPGGQYTVRHLEDAFFPGLGR